MDHNKVIFSQNCVVCVNGSILLFVGYLDRHYYMLVVVTTQLT